MSIFLQVKLQNMKHYMGLKCMICPDNQLCNDQNASTCFLKEEKRDVIWILQAK